ncbi:MULTISPECIES: hypothetical protein [unclassified Microcoleus]|uniref:hypothetical protein n=1 Tax=unclassified Microcoleus TaxID=2642155 RepID=UPI001D56B535|nr:MULTISPECIES: hypothetical protein [unclassified Microcoleus]MCC3419550.1 hypothetical protein [Microcoleus sp. PH2017_07_MST_O_A]MCC3510995.1 hypothetical protein [Microcoleus sp. PH2017_17_BER_D_A]MCC3412160.1 hypothetical protein [Microcoleus sp. PH2017_02_FOX_O_A]MCC3427416.1 hypothetical protein [Microcoleus sp. PH2017_01_SCD_O_A]MCC3446306.1 hypothetical protein [Microcoleus sp. PH2017_09_SFU_O_A]
MKLSEQGSAPYSYEFNGKKPQLGRQPKVLPSQLLVAEVLEAGKCPIVRSQN